MNSSLHQQIKDDSTTNHSNFDLDQPSPSNNDYYRMDLKPAARTRSWTVESGMSDISFLSDDTQGKSWNGESDMSGLSCQSMLLEMKKLSMSPYSTPESEYNSLPTKLSYQYPVQLCKLRRQYVTRVSSDRCPGKLTNNSNYLPQKSTNRRMIRTSQSIGCLTLEPETHSQVLMFLPKMLRSSFSKIMSIPRRSKSPVSNKNSLDNDSLSLSLSDTNRLPSSSSLVSPITEEIVNESMEKGLPIIPFAYPTFHVANSTFEEDKQPTSKNSLKNLKMAFCENKWKNKNIYQEEEEISEAPHRSKFLSLNEISSEDVDEEESSKSEVKDIQKKKASDGSCNSQSAYVEMNPGKNHKTLESHSTQNNFGEEPYMHMNEFMVGENKVVNGFSRKFSEEQIFHLEQGSPKQKEAPTFKNKIPEYSSSSSSSSSSKRGTFLSMRDGTMSMERGLSRLHRKGNKHKGDYMFVDFEKNNYVDMQQLGTKKWKFLTFHSTGKKREK